MPLLQSTAGAFPRDIKVKDSTMFYAPATFEIFPNLFFRLEHSFCSAFAMMRHQWTFLLSGILISVCAARFLPPLSLERFVIFPIVP